MPYYSQRRTLDMFGLTDEHIAHLPPIGGARRQAGHEKFAPDYVLDRRPDLIVTRLSPGAQLTSAGLQRAAARLRACYVPLLLAGDRKRSRGGEWLVFTNRVTPEHYAQGYETAVLRRRRGAAAAGCRALERRRRAMLAAQGVR